MMQMANQMANPIRIHRFTYRLGIFILILFIFIIGLRSDIGNFFNRFRFSGSVSHFSKYVDENGDYLPYSGHKILQLIQTPLPSDLISLRNHLNSQTELTTYFQSLPPFAYHITLVNFKSKLSLTKEQLAKLEDEQELLDRVDTNPTCLCDTTFIENGEIRLLVKIAESTYIDALTEYQARWNKNFGDLIDQQYSYFNITLAYQYKPIPSKQVYKQLEDIIKQWDMYPIQIVLDPIEICSYKDIISFNAVVPDALDY